MSYRTHSLGSISVGQTATRDPVLARASLLASQVLVRVTKLPKDEREAAAVHELNRIRSGLGAAWKKELARLLAKGVSRDQAIFDAMRLVIANRFAQEGVDLIRMVLARYEGAEALGDDTARDVGCAITGGTTAIVGTIFGAYTGGAGSAAMSTGGQLIGQALNCGAREAAAQQASAAAQAAAAQAQLQLAQQQAAAAQARRDDYIKYAMIGGGTLAVITALVVALK